MRIFQVIEGSTNSAVSGNRVWIRNLHEPLVEMGHEVVLVSADPGRQAHNDGNDALRKRFSESVLNRFLEEHRKQPFQLAFFYLMEGMFDAELIAQVRSHGVVTTNFSCNNIHQFHLVRDISHLFDLNLYSEKEAAHLFRGIDVPAHWWPMAANPTYARPVSTRLAPFASFVGACYGTRLENVRQLLLAGIDLRLFGPGWQSTLAGRRDNAIFQLLRQVRNLRMRRDKQAWARFAAREAFDALRQAIAEEFRGAFGGIISDDRLIELYSQSAVSLGFLEVLDNHDPLGRRLRHLHLRDFEAPMAGALYVVDYSAELAELFEPNKEVLMPRDLYERIDITRYYVERPEKGNAIRTRARERALAEHTYHRRFEDLFRRLGL